MKIEFRWYGNTVRWEWGKGTMWDQGFKTYELGPLQIIFYDK